MYKIPETSVTQKVGDELVILDLDSGKYFGLDEVGARMIELIGESGDLNKVVSTMLNEYDVEEAQLRVDLDELLTELIQHNLITKDS